MRWAHRPRHVPGLGTKRTVTRFAFVPRLVDGDAGPVWLWLEWYDVQQEYGDNGYIGGWVTIARYPAMDV